MERQHAPKRTSVAAECLPGEVLERVLARVPFVERCGDSTAQMPTLCTPVDACMHLSG
jgi:hypothetical protein